MPSLKAMLTLGLKDSISKGLPKVNTSLKNMGNSVESLNNKMSGLLGTSLKLGGVLGVSIATKNIINYSDDLNRLGIQAGISTKEVNSLKNSMFKASVGSKISMGSLQDSVTESMNLTGNLPYINANLKNMAVAIQATHASGKDIGSLFAQFSGLGLNVKDSAIAFDMLNIQGKRGAITMQDMAAQASKLLSSYSAITTRSGLDSVKEAGTLMQIFRNVTGSADETTTVFQSFMNAISNPAIQKKLSALGVKLKDNAGHMRSGVDILKDTINKTHNMQQIKGIFADTESQKAFYTLYNDKMKNGKITLIDKFNVDNADGSTTTKDAKKAASSMKSQLQGLRAVLEKIEDQTLAPIISSLADFLDKLKMDKIERIFNIGKDIAIGLASLYAFTKGLKLLFGTIRAGTIAFKFSKGLFSKSGKSPLTTALTSKPLDVFVLNMPSSGLSGSSGGTSSGATTGYDNTPQGKANRRARARERLQARTRRNSRIGRITGGTLRRTGRGLGGAIVGTGLMVANTALSASTSPNKKARNEIIGEGIGGVAGATMGEVIGTTIGATVGSVLPGVGTVIVGAIGGMIGSALGGWLGGAGGKGVADVLSSKVSQPKSQPYNINHEFKHVHTHNYNGMGVSTTTQTTHVKSTGPTPYNLGGNMASY